MLSGDFEKKLFEKKQELKKSRLNVCLFIVNILSAGFVVFPLIEESETFA